MTRWAAHRLLDHLYAYKYVSLLWWITLDRPITLPHSLCLALNAYGVGGFDSHPWLFPLTHEYSGPILVRKGISPGGPLRSTVFRSVCVPFKIISMQAWVEHAIWLVWSLPHQLCYCHTNISHIYHCWPHQEHTRYTLLMSLVIPPLKMILHPCMQVSGIFRYSSNFLGKIQQNI